jgi:hypothetical protein
MPMPILKSVLAAAIVLAGVASAGAQGKTVVLIAGAGGATPFDFLVRNRDRIAASGAATVVTETIPEAVSAAKSAAAKGSRVIIVGMSRGASYAASALAEGAPANGVVFVSGGYADIEARLGSPARLPRGLAVHNRQDACPKTPPAAAAGFARWARGKVAVRMLDIGGAPVRNPCGPRGGHGYFMQVGAAVAAIVGFIRTH